MICSAVLDGGDALRHDQHGAVSGLFLERAAQCGIGLEVKRGEAVVEDIDRRFFDQRAGDREALFLSARDVGAALGNFGLPCLPVWRR